MNTIQNLSYETQRYLINAMAQDIHPLTDLAQEHHVARDLANAKWSASIVNDHLTDVIERARALRQSEPLRDDSTGIAEWLRTTAAVSLAAAGWFAVWCALPEPAMAMTMDDAKGVMLRGLYALCAFLVIAIAVWLSALVLFRKDAEDAEYETYDTSDLERRRRNAGGE